MRQLSEDFLIDLAKSCIVSREVLDIIKPHLKYSYLPSDSYKAIYKYIFDYHGAHMRSPTIGLLAESVVAPNALPIIAKIRTSNPYDNKEEIISKFEEYVKNVRTQTLLHKVVEIINPKGDSPGDPVKATEVLAEESKLIHEFSLKTKMHSRIFADFDKRQMEREQQNVRVRKIPTGIPQLDYHSRGGPDRGTGLLGIARTGVGKTTFLRSLGHGAAFRGNNVLHFASPDSTKKEVEDGYDAAWTGVDMNDMREGKLSGIDMKTIQRERKAYLAQCGEIFVHAFTKFNSCSILDCRSILVELLKEVDIGMVIFDYLEKFDPGDGKKYSTNQEGSTARKIATAEAIVGIATEFDLVSASMTQANDIPKDMWNDPTKVLTRSNISNARATADPFAYVLTLNQTDDENDKDIMRIHEEKLRHYKIMSYASTYKIAQARSIGRFIDVKKTNELYWDVEKKQIIRNKLRA